MSAAAVAGFHVIEASAAAIWAYVPLKPSFAEEYEVYPEIKVVLPRLQLMFHLKHQHLLWRLQTSQLLDNSESH
jgi:hypothetical protein